MIAVLKVGGSLAAEPSRLRRVLAAAADGLHGPCVVVPGGGAFADAVRVEQARAGFDDAEAHRRALDAMGRMADRFLDLELRLTCTRAPWAAASPPPSAWEGGPRVSEGRERGAPAPDLAPPIAPPASLPAPALPSPPPLRGVPSPAEGGGMSAATVWDPVLLRPGHPDIQESWDVTSDSLALWLAARLSARLCALVKSADAPAGADPADLARAGLVDAAFPAFAARFGGAIEVWGPGGAVRVRGPRPEFAHGRVAA